MSPFSIADLQQGFLDGLREEWRPAGHQLVEDRAHRVDVACGADRVVPTGGLLGRQVIRRSQGLAGQGEA